jgi:hypothetical protein
MVGRRPTGSRPAARRRRSTGVGAAADAAPSRTRVNAARTRPSAAARSSPTARRRASSGASVRRARLRRRGGRRSSPRPLRDLRRPGLHQVSAEPPERLPGTRSGTAAGGRSPHPRKVPILVASKYVVPWPRGPQSSGRTVGPDRCGASTSRSGAGPPTVRRRQRSVGRSPCAIQSGPSSPPCSRPPSECVRPPTDEASETTGPSRFPWLLA